MSFFNRKIGSPNVDGIERGEKYYNEIYSEDYPAEKYIPIYEIIISYINSLKLQEINILDVGCFPNSDGNAIGVKVTFRIINSTSPTTLDIILQGVR